LILEELSYPTLFSAKQLASFLLLTLASPESLAATSYGCSSIGSRDTMT